MSADQDRGHDPGDTPVRKVDLSSLRLPRRATELPEALAIARELEAIAAATLAVHTVVKGFCVTWRHHPTERAQMVDTGPDVAAADPYDLATTAAVVRGLCERWDHPTPDWVEGIVAPTEITYMGKRMSDTPLDRIRKAKAPPACHTHHVYYEADLLERKRDVLARVGAEIAAALARRQPNRQAATIPIRQSDQTG